MNWKSTLTNPRKRVIYKFILIQYCIRVIEPIYKSLHMIVS